MVTYRVHRLIIGKVEIKNFYLSQCEYLDFFTELFIGYSSTFYKTFVQIAESDWLPRQQKGSFSKNVNLFLRNH